MGLQKALPETCVAKQYRQQAQDDTLDEELRKAYALLAKAEAELEAEDDEAAREAADQCLELCRRMGNKDLAGDAARYSTKALINCGKLDQAKRSAAQDLEDFKSSDNERGQACMHLCLSSLADDAAEALQHAVSSGTLFHRLADKRLECAALIAMCEAQLNKEEGLDVKRQGHSALATATMARDLAREAGDLTCEADALHAMGRAQARLECYEEALRYSDEALDLYMELKDKKRMAQELLALSDMSLVLGENKMAMSHAQDALEIFQELGSRQEIEAIQSVYKVQAMNGDLQGARKSLNRALKRFSELDNSRAQVMCLFMLVNLTCKEGEVAFLEDKSVDKYKAALTLTQKALRIVRHCDDTRIETRLLVILSALCLRLDRLDGAMLAGQQALRMIKEGGDTQWGMSAKYELDGSPGVSNSNAGDVLFTLSNAYMRADQPDEAVKVTEELMQFFQKNGNKRGQASAFMSMVQSYLKMDNKVEAMKAAMQAQQLFNEAGDPAGEAHVLRHLMDAEWERKDYAAAVRLGERAAALFREAQDARSEAASLYGVASYSLAFAVSLGARVGEVTSRQERVIADALNKAEKVADNAVRITKELNSIGVVTGTLLAACLATLAQVHMFASKPGVALECADEAVILFREQGDYRSEGAALLQSADALRVTGQIEEAKEAANEAFMLLRKFGDKAGEEVAMDILEYLAQIERGESGIGAFDDCSDSERGPRPADRRAPPRPAGADRPPASARKGRSLCLEAEVRPSSTWAHPTSSRPFREIHKTPDLDPSKVRERILELAGNALGMIDQPSLDTPLMEVGMTSNAAIIFRDELQEELPSVTLPVTLVFDYPSVAAIMRLILQQRRAPAKPIAG